MDNLRALYQEVIIDHARNPRNFGTLDKATQCSTGFNPLCGDKLRLCLICENDCITQLRFQGEGCAISMASASLLTEHIQGQTPESARKIFDDFQAMLLNNAEPSDKLGKLSILQGVAEFPVRIKCATLVWHALIAALNNENDVSTE